MKIVNEVQSGNITIEEVENIIKDTTKKMGKKVKKNCLKEQNGNITIKIL